MCDFTMHQNSDLSEANTKLALEALSHNSIPHSIEDRIDDHAKIEKLLGS